MRWQVRYRDPEGKSRNRSFERKVDAERFRVDLQHGLSHGRYFDERSGRALLADFAADWIGRQALAPTSMVAVELRLRVHILPEWGAWPVSKIPPAGIQRWARGLSDELSPGYVRLILTTFGTLLASAQQEGLIAQNPVRSSLVKFPAVPKRRVRPWTIEQVLQVIDHIPRRFAGLVIAAASCGLRQGEAFGLRIQDVDFVRRELHVRQQIRIEYGRPAAALPKYERVRLVPMPEWVSSALEESIARFSPLRGERLERPGLGGLLFYSRESKPLNRNYFNQAIWRPAIQAAGIPNERGNGMHALRHACASQWLEHGVSIKAVSEYLGHADPGFTLRVYTHVMPTSGDKARNAIDAAVGVGRRPADAASSAGAPWAHETAPTGGN